MVALDVDEYVVGFLGETAAIDFTSERPLDNLGNRDAVGADLFGQAPALAYLADLGTWDGDLAAALADVDLLAVEFNHDVELERTSGRMPALIARVLSDEGHLSNDQAAGLVRTVQERSTTGRLRHLVQLHLSQECNRPNLAREAARVVLDELSQETRLHTARQDAPGPALDLEGNGKRRRVRASAPRRSDAGAYLPGLEMPEE